MNRVKISSWASLIALVSSLLWSTPLCTAQTPKPSAAAEETIELPTFRVLTEKDVGYIAGDTISGGRLSTNVLKTPSDLTVLTREFLDDLGVGNLNEAGLWLTSSTVTPATERDFGATIGFRGLPSGNSTRNYFYYPTTADEYIVERLEGSRGPNAIIYGDALSGGQYNILIKRASLNKDFTRVAVRTDSEGSYRSTVDTNWRANKQLAVRFNGLWQQRRTWQQAFKDDRIAGDLTGSVQPWKGAELRGEVEFGYSKVSVMNATFTDGYSNWDGITTVSAPLTANPSSTTGLSRNSADQLTASPSFGLINLINFARTGGTGLRINDITTGITTTRTKIQPLPRRGFNAQPADAYLGTHFRTLSAFFEQTFFEKLTVELAVQDHAVNRKAWNTSWSNAQTDVNRVLPNGAANPNFGKMYSETTLGGSGETPNFVTSYRAAAAYPLDFAGQRQTFSVVAQRRINVFDPVYFGFRRINGTVLDTRNSANAVNFRQYWDAPNDRLYVPPLQDASGNKFDWVMNRDTHEYSTLDSIQANTIGSYWGNRITLIGGYRRDVFDFDSRNILTFDAAGYPATTSHNLKYAKVDTNSLGFTFFPIPSIGVYASRSVGFAPNTLNFPDIYGVFSIPLTTNLANSAGLRFNFLGGKLVGSAGYYQSVEADRPTSLSGTGVNRIWVNLNKPAQQIAGGAFGTYLDTFDYKAHGWELDLTANLSREAKLKFNIAFPTAEQNNGYYRTRAYYEANIAEWTAGGANTAIPNASQIRSDIASIETTLSNAANGRKINGMYKYRANFFGNYELSSGMLKGLRLGGGVNVFGRQLIGNQLTSAFDYIYMKQYFVTTASLGYRVKIYRKPVDIQINVSNLLDFKDPVYSGTGTSGGVVYLNAYSYVEPRRIQLTLSTTF
jgi:outer membrane receptor for ferric coprogen and ferric-rhodotorulic acid